MPCLVRERSKEFLNAIRDGRITPEKMLNATSKERQAILEPIIGKDNVPWVNAALEEKILLKDQKRGMASWAKKTAGLTPEARRDLLSKIEKHDRVFDPKTGDEFLESLAEHKFGTAITFEEAKNISNLAAKERASKAKIPESDPIGSKARTEYGATRIAFQDYVHELKQTAGKIAPSISEHPVEAIQKSAEWAARHPVETIYRSAGAAKSALSTLDNSFFGRQGIKMLFTNPDIWAKDFVQSWGRFGKELMGKDAMFAVKADAFSRPNALNGKYDALGIDIGLQAEEAFPSQALTKIPILGRLAKGAESAFNGAAIRFRVDLADRVIANAERQGIDVLDKAQGKPIGNMVNAMTGRGNIGKLDVFGKQINATIFSIKFLKSNFDTLTAHQFQKGVTPFVRKQAAMNLAKIIGSLAGIYGTANLLSPGSAELDPRSGRFGKIKIKDTIFDPSGGMASLVTLASRLIPTVHNGKLGWFSKSRTGEVKELGTNKYGSKSPLDVFYDFTEGKFAPYAALLRDLLRGHDFKGEKTYIEGHRLVPTPRTVYGAHAPIPLQNFEETMRNPNSAPVLVTTILDGLGIGASTYTPRAKKSTTLPKLPE